MDAGRLLAVDRVAKLPPQGELGRPVLQGLELEKLPSDCDSFFVGLQKGRTVATSFQMRFEGGCNLRAQIRGEVVRDQIGFVLAGSNRFCELSRRSAISGAASFVSIVHVGCTGSESNPSGQWLVHPSWLRPR